MKKQHRLFLLLLFAFPRLYAQSVPTLVENPPDNSQGFAVYLRAGLHPLPENARPVQYIFRSHHDFFSSGDNQFPGWTWDEDGETRLLIGNRIWDGPAVNQSRGMRSADPRDGDALRFQEGNLQQMVRNLFQNWIRTREHGGNIRMRPHEAGQHMLLAVRLHETGHADYANQLAAFLFEQVGRREALMAGLSALHDLNYGDEVEAYFREGDLQALVTATEAALEKNRATWMSARIIDEELQRWKESLGWQADAPEGFTPQQAAFWTSFSEISHPAFLQHSLQSNMLLSPKALHLSRIQHDPEVPETLPALIDSIWQLGPDLIPVLIALTEDTRVLPTNAARLPMMRSQRFTSREDMELNELRRSLPRPAGVGDLAEVWLNRLLPGRGHRNLSGDELTAEARDFHAKIQNKSRMDIARLILEEAEDLSNLGGEVLFTLLASKDSGVIGELHSKIMAQVEVKLSNVGMSVMRYPALFQGEEGETFRLALISKIEELYGDQLDDEENWEADMAKNTLQHLRRMGGVPEEEADVTLDDVIGFVLNNEMEKLQELNPTAWMSDDPVLIQKTILPRIAEANASQEEMLGQMLMFLLNQIRSGERWDPMLHMHGGEIAFYENPEGIETAQTEEPSPEDDEEEVSEPVEITLIPELWEPLLRRTGKDLGRATSLAAHLLTLKHPDIEEAYYSIAGLQEVLPQGDPKLAEFLIPLALSVLQNPDMDWTDQLPSADKVPEERAEALEQILLGQDAEAVRTVLNTRDFNEILLLQDMLYDNDVMENTAMWSQLVRERRLLLDLPEELADTLQAKGLTAGSVVDEAKVLALFAYGREQAAAGESGQIILMESLLPLGMRLLLSADSMNFMEEAGLMVVFADEFYRTYNMTEELKLEASEEESSDEDSFMMGLLGGNDNEFAEAVRSWLQAKENPEESYLVINYAGSNEEGEEEE